jgi:hypothetical protein
MKNPTIPVIVFYSLLAFALPAQAIEIYRYGMPDGSILFTDEVSTKGVLQEVMESPEPDITQMEAARKAQLKREVDSANRFIAQRTASMNAINHEISDAAQALANAKAARKAGIVPLPGERLGNMDGHTRLAPEYWARQRRLQQVVDETREWLDDAYVAFNAKR